MTAVATRTAPQTIPPDVARKIADDFGHDVVIIICPDFTHAETHTASFGRKAVNKAIATKLAEQIVGFMGADLSCRQTPDEIREEEAAGPTDKNGRDAIKMLRRLVDDNAIASRHAVAVEDFLRQVPAY